MAIDTINEKLALIDFGDIWQPGIPISADGLDVSNNGCECYQQWVWMLATEDTFQPIEAWRSHCRNVPGSTEVDRNHTFPAGWNAARPCRTVS